MMAGFLEFIQEMGFAGVFDIAFMSLLVYTLLVWFKRTRAAFVLTGILIIGGVYLLAREFGLVLTSSILQGFFAVILLAIIVIFQEELRHFFEQVAMWSLNPNIRRRRSIRGPRREVETLVRTLSDLAREKIGALVILQGRNPVVRHLDGGIDLNGELSESLVKSLFDPHSIGHDGAVVIEHDQVTQFSCQLPLSKNFEKLQQSGTRHAAALGLAELTDSLCLVVSEEKGVISAARHGDIRVIKNAQELSDKLEHFYQEVFPSQERKAWQEFFRRNYQEKAIAIVIASTLWFALVHESKVVERTVTRPVEYAPLSEPYQVVQIIPDYVDITLTGARKDFYFFNPDKVTLSVKLFDVEAQTKTLLLSESNVSIPQELVLERIEPQQIQVRVEKMRSVK